MKDVLLRILKKIERWRKIAKEASEQAYRTIVPEIVDVVYFGDLIKKNRKWNTLLGKSTNSPN